VIFREIAFDSPDFQQECSLRNEVLRRPLGLNLYDENLSREQQQWHFGLFDADGAITACAVAVPLADHQARIRQMAVAERCQRQGHGTRIMTEVEAVLHERGFRRLVLHARVPAVAFYERLGYAVTGDEFLEIGIPHAHMEKRL
jgi:predicted GNAT family N-acyltransferase